MNKKILVGSAILLTFIIFFFLFFTKECNVSYPFSYQEQRCKCLGILISDPPRSPADDGPISDFCIGIITHKYTVERGE